MSLSQNLNSQIIESTFNKADFAQKNKRSYFKFKKPISYFNPLAYVGGALLFTYQNLFSQQIQADCVYKISCSEYTRQAITKHGFIIGTLKGFNQLSECFNDAIYEHPPIFTFQNKIINDSKD